MPDGAQIRATAPDGTVHVFPAGTADAVVDRVMKQYITSSQAPQTRPGDAQAGSYQARKGGPVLNTGDSPMRSAALGAERMLGINNPQSLTDAFRQAGRSAGQFASDTYKDWESGLQKEAHGYAPEFVTKPLAAAMTPLDMAARGIEGLASGIEGGARDIYAGVKQGDPRAAASGTGSILALGAMMHDPETTKDFGAKVSETGRLLKQQDAINRGQVQVVNEHVRKPLAMLDARVNHEIGAHVKAAVDADQAHMQATGSTTGLVNATDAAVRANEKLGKMGITFPPQLSSLIDAAANPMTLNDAKTLTTDVGRASAALTRQGNMRPAAVLNELYDGLHQATQARADELGMGKSWRQYIDLARSYKGLQEGLLGELVDEPNHAKAMGKLIDPSNATEWNEIRDELDKRGIDTTSFEKAREYAKSMSALQNKNSNLFAGKVRAIIKHPFLAGGAAAGAAMLGHASGVPGMSFVLPIVAAGKVAGLLDAAQMRNLLQEISQSVPPEAGRVGEALPEPMPSQTPTSGAPTPEPKAPIPITQGRTGLIDKGEAVVGSGVRQYEIPGQEGKTVAVSPKKMAELGSQQALEQYVRDEVAKKASAPTATDIKKRMLGGINQQGMEQGLRKASLADKVQALRTENLHMKERLQQAGSAVFSDEEIEQMEKRQEENAKLIKELLAEQKRAGKR